MSEFASIHRPETTVPWHYKEWSNTMLSAILVIAAIAVVWIVGVIIAIKVLGAFFPVSNRDGAIWLAGTAIVVVMVAVCGFASLGLWSLVS